MKLLASAVKSDGRKILRKSRSGNDVELAAVESRPSNLLFGSRRGGHETPAPNYSDGPLHV